VSVGAVVGPAEVGEFGCLNQPVRLDGIGSCCLTTSIGRPLFLSVERHASEASAEGMVEMNCGWSTGMSARMVAAILARAAACARAVAKRDSAVTGAGAMLVTATEVAVPKDWLGF